MQIKITELIILTTISIISSIIIETNKLGMNIDKGIKKSNIVYISDAMVSALCGISLSLITMLISKNNLILWIIASIIGTVLGKSSFKIIAKLFLTFLNLFKQADIDKIIKDIDKNNDRTNDNTNNEGS